MADELYDLADAVWIPPPPGTRRAKSNASVFPPFIKLPGTWLAKLSLCLQ